MSTYPCAQNLTATRTEFVKVENPLLCLYAGGGAAGSSSCIPILVAETEAASRVGADNGWVEAVWGKRVSSTISLRQKLLTKQSTACA